MLHTRKEVAAPCNMAILLHTSIGTRRFFKLVRELKFIQELRWLGEVGLNPCCRFLTLATTHFLVSKASILLPEFYALRMPHSSHACTSPLCLVSIPNLLGRSTHHPLPCVRSFFRLPCLERYKHQLGIFSPWKPNWEVRHNQNPISPAENVAKGFPPACIIDIAQHGSGLVRYKSLERFGHFNYCYCPTPLLSMQAQP